MKTMKQMKQAVKDAAVKTSKVLDDNRIGSAVACGVGAYCAVIIASGGAYAAYRVGKFALKYYGFTVIATGVAVGTAVGVNRYKKDQSKFVNPE